MDNKTTTKTAVPPMPKLALATEALRRRLAHKSELPLSVINEGDKAYLYTTNDGQLLATIGQSSDGKYKMEPTQGDQLLDAMYRELQFLILDIADDIRAEQVKVQK